MDNRTKEQVRKNETKVINEIKDLEQRVKNQKEVIDKAIDYIENKCDYFDDGIISEEDGTTFEYVLKIDVDYLLEILKEVSK